MDVCGWLVWGMWVVRMVALVVMRSWPLTAWDGPSARSSFAGLFLGGILWVFCRAHEHSGHQGYDSSAEGKVKTTATNSRTKEHDMCRSAWENRERSNCPGLGAHAGLFIVKDHESFYNVVTTF
jgi:hypothetical protein